MRSSSRAARCNDKIVIRIVAHGDNLRRRYHVRYRPNESNPFLSLVIRDAGDLTNPLVLKNPVHLIQDWRRENQRMRRQP
jgi:hypothetical protein